MKKIDFNKTEKGITLIALIVTVVILIILAGVTIKVGIIDGELWKNLNINATEQEKQTIRDKIEMIGTNHVTKKVLNDNITDDDLKQDLVDAGIVASKDNVEGENGEYTITTPKGYIFFLTIDYKGNVQVKYEKIRNSTKITIDKTPDSPIWHADTHTATIKLETKEPLPDGAKIQYQINNTEPWIDYNEKIDNLNHEDKVSARVYSEKDYEVMGTVEIVVLDTTPPELAEIKLSTNNVATIKTVTATITHIDNQTGIKIQNCKWVYTDSQTSIGITDEKISEYTGEFTGNGQEIELAKKEEGTYYLHVLSVDQAGNRRETVSEEITVRQPTAEELNKAPVINTVTYQSKTTNSITVTANAIDDDEDELTYTIYTSDSENGTYTARGSATGSSGANVILTASGLSQYELYYYYVDVVDPSMEKDESAKGQNQRTYCPTTLCSGKKEVETKCTKCSNGKIYNNCRYLLW